MIIDNDDYKMPHEPWFPITRLHHAISGISGCGLQCDRILLLIHRGIWLISWWELQFDQMLVLPLISLATWLIKCREPRLLLHHEISSIWRCEFYFTRILLLIAFITWLIMMRMVAPHSFVSSAEVICGYRLCEYRLCGYHIFKFYSSGQGLLESSYSKLYSI